MLPSSGDKEKKSKWFHKTGASTSTGDSSIVRTMSKQAVPPPKGWKDRFSPTYWWRVLRLNMQPHKPVKGNPTTLESIKAVVFATWLNVLLIFIPVSWVAHYVIKDPIVRFVTAFFAIIPLAKLLGFATEELALRVGQTVGGLLNATLGNAVELIVSIVALLQCQTKIVQSSLVGSILSNLLLVLGMCFFAGGTRFSEQGFAAAASQLNSSLLVVSVIAVLLPAAYYFAVGTPTTDAQKASEGKSILSLSRGVAIILLVTYGAYLIFQLWSHAHLYDDDSDDNFKTRKFQSSKKVDKHKKALHSDSYGMSTGANSDGGTTDKSNLNPRPNGDGLGDLERQESNANGEEEEEEEEVPKLNVTMCIVTLVIVTVLVAVTAEYLVDSIDALTEKGGISKEWVGLILLPIVGNAAEHVTAVTVSVKDKLTLSLGVAAGSSIQIALFVIPFMVTLGWMVGKPLTLLFDPFEAITLFLAVITVNYVTADGRTNWLEGLILMNLYFIIAVSFWYYPGTDPSSSVLKCVR